MNRTLLSQIKKDLLRKIILISGPRQVGKTTLARMLNPSFDYLSFDDSDDRMILKEKAWDRNKKIVIFDELHKMPKWKSWLKGVYDKEGLPPALVVTGSAKLDTYKKVGDSLAGRYFHFRLHPLDLWELKKIKFSGDSDKLLHRLLSFSGYPEPFLENEASFYSRWKATHTDIILRQDLLDLESIQSIKKIELLLDLLRNRVGSPISYRSLSEDLDASDKTIKRWLTILENLYVIFAVYPHHKNISRAVKKAPKYYFFDTAQVRGDDGIKLENLVACSLLKQIHFKADVLGQSWQLCYFRTKEKREIDFIILKDQSPFLACEVKWADGNPAHSFKELNKFLPEIKKVQLVGQLRRETTYPSGLEIRKASNWLSKMEW